MAAAAEYLGVTERWLRRHLDEIPRLKLGRLNLFRPDDLDAFAKASLLPPARGPLAVRPQDAARRKGRQP
jgi:excisionase family DNA binding protein